MRVLSTFPGLPKSPLGHKLSLNALIRVSAFCRSQTLSRPDPGLSLLTAQPDSRVVRTSSALPFLSQRWSLGVVNWLGRSMRAWSFNFADLEERDQLGVTSRHCFVLSTKADCAKRRRRNGNQPTAVWVSVDALGREAFKVMPRLVTVLSDHPLDKTLIFSINCAPSHGEARTPSLVSRAGSSSMPNTRRSGRTLRSRPSLPQMPKTSTAFPTSSNSSSRRIPVRRRRVVSREAMPVPPMSHRLPPNSRAMDKNREMERTQRRDRDLGVRRKGAVAIMRAERAP